MSKIPIALQMYTLRSETAKDFVGTLKKVAEIGYAGAEFAGTGPLSASELKSLIDGLGLEPAGSHIGLEQLETNISKVIDFNLEIGNKYIVCPGVPEERRNSEKAWKALAEAFNKIGAECKKHNMTFSYHNHSAEFEKFNGKYGLDILLESSDPELVYSQVDTFWVQYAGVDPAGFIKKHPGRCLLVHIKDMADDEKKSFAEIGEGILDFQAIFAACEEAGTKWYIVEQDTCSRPPLESVRISFENLKSWGMA